MATPVFLSAIAVVAQSPAPKPDVARAVASASVVIVAAEEVAFERPLATVNAQEVRSQKALIRVDGARTLIEFF